jgi:predicted RNase H-like nuclease (RuvC/YqgF family)
MGLLYSCIGCGEYAPRENIEEELCSACRDANRIKELEAEVQRLRDENAALHKLVAASDRREEGCGQQIRKTKYKYMQDRVVDDIHKEEDKRVFNDLLASYSKSDKWDDLRNSQLQLMAESDHGPLIRFLEDNTFFDHQRIRLLLETGSIKAKEILDGRKEE